MQLAVVSKFQGHLGNACSFILVNKKKSQGTKWSEEGGGPQPCFLQPNIAVLTKHCVPLYCYDDPSCHSSAAVLGIFSRLLLQTLENLAVEMLAT